jgi:2-polyprenyl-6-methoxyphenol hydroxylase-like FAD-dependent oxidoreductase
MEKMYDVIIVGFGPAGMVAACLLGRAGHRVAVFERYPSIYNLPRVGGVHDDVLRIFQELGLADRIMADGSIPALSDIVHDDVVLFESPFSERTIHGWPQLLSIYQPFVEGAMDQLAKSMPNVEIRQGFPVVAVSQTADYAEVMVEERASGARSIARARYLIAADGGNSFVRDALGLMPESLGFDQEWVVIDARVKRERPDWPIMRLYGNPERPGLAMKMGQNFRRWALMVNDDEERDEIVRPEKVWELLDREAGATPDEVELIRQACYTFKSFILPEWKIGRIFMVGDAAHVMPPFLGQGMCSGLRDSHNISWKLDLVLRSVASARLLETYMIERVPNVRAMILESVRLGRSVIERDPVKVASRDELLLGLKTSKAKYGLIGYRPVGVAPGFFATSDAISKGAGEVFVQGTIVQEGHSLRFDDAAGPNFVAISRSGDPRAALSDEQARFWEQIGGRSFQLGAAGNGAQLVDVDGDYGRAMDAYGCDVIVRRPDHYIFGTARSIADLPRLIDNIRDQLTGDVPWAVASAPSESMKVAP